MEKRDLFLKPFPCFLPPPKHTEIQVRCFSCNKFEVCRIKNDYLKTAQLISNVLGNPCKNELLTWIPYFKGEIIEEPQKYFPFEVEMFMDGKLMKGRFVSAKRPNKNTVLFVYETFNALVMFAAFYKEEEIEVTNIESDENAMTNLVNQILEGRDGDPDPDPSSDPDPSTDPDPDPNPPANQEPEKELISYYTISLGRDVYYGVPFGLTFEAIQTISQNLKSLSRDFVCPCQSKKPMDVINTTYFSARLDCEQYDPIKKKSYDECYHEVCRRYPHGVPMEDGELYHLATYHMEPQKVPYYKPFPLKPCEVKPEKVYEALKIHRRDDNGIQ